MKAQPDTDGAITAIGKCVERRVQIFGRQELVLPLNDETLMREAESPGGHEMH